MRIYNHATILDNIIECWYITSVDGDSLNELPLSEIERKGLIAHGLSTDTASQLSDAFRLGMAWMEAHIEEQKCDCSNWESAGTDPNTWDKLKLCLDCGEISVR